MHDYQREKTTVIAHRGGAGLFAENTMGAFMQAQDLGVDAIECDVHLTKDHGLVVIHDPDLNRVAGIDRKISDLTMEEIRGIRLKDGNSIPSLEEVLEATSIHLVIELKGGSTVAALFSIFDSNRKYIQRCAVISFFHAALPPLKQKYRDLSTGALLAGFPVNPVSVADEAAADYLAFNFEGLTAEYVNLCHKGNKRVSVWTPNTEEEIQSMIDSGVDSIATDRPDTALRLLGRA